MSAVLPSASASRLTTWRQALPVLLLALASVVLLYRESFAAMVRIWEGSATFTHAFLVAPISLWLVWRQRETLAALAPRPQPWLMLFMLPLAVAWLLGNLAGVNALTQAAATAMLVLTVPVMLGLTVARAITFPLAFLFFMVPIGDFMMPTLMLWTADVTVWVLRLCGLPVYREGQQFIIPSGTWSVVEACSGMRFLISSFMVGTLFAYLNFRSARRRVLFGVVALVVPVVANWGRALMIVTIGHLSSNTLAVGVDHLVYGWVFFGIVMMIMFFIGSRWSEEPALHESTVRESGTAPVNSAPRLTAVLLVALLCLPPAVAWRIHEAPAAMPALVLPDLINVTFGADQTPLHRPHFVGSRAEGVAVYGDDADAVTVHVAFYRQQTYGHKLINSANALVDSADSTWHIAESAPATAVTADGRRIALRGAELREGQLGGSRVRRVCARQVYWVDGSFTTSDVKAALWALGAQISGRGDDAAAITFFRLSDKADCHGQPLDVFVGLHLETLGLWLTGVREQR